MFATRREQLTIRVHTLLLLPSTTTLAPRQSLHPHSSHTYSLCASYTDLLKHASRRNAIQLLRNKMPQIKIIHEENIRIVSPYIMPTLDCYWLAPQPVNYKQQTANQDSEYRVRLPVRRPKLAHVPSEQSK